MAHVTISEVLEEKKLRLKVMAKTTGLDNEVTFPRVQKPGLLLTGIIEELHNNRIQIFGAAEVDYLSNVTEEKLKTVLSVLGKPNIPAIIITRGLEAPASLVDLAKSKNIPILLTSLTSSVFIERLLKFLEDALAPTESVHGVFMDVLGIGVLIKGKSGIGKSECALDLITRGYRLVADDVVVVKRLPNSTLIGSSAEVTRHYIEVRGLGIINIKDLYGITAIRSTKQMDLVVELVSWDEEKEYDRLGIDDDTEDILGVELPHKVVPVSPGRSVATIVEVAARNRILKIMGYNPAGDFVDKLAQSMQENTALEKKRKDGS